MKKRKIRGRGERDGRRERVAPVGVTSCKFVFHKSHSYHTISPSLSLLPLSLCRSLFLSCSPSPFGARTHDLCINAEIRRAERNRFRQATTPNDFQRTPARALACMPVCRTRRGEEIFLVSRATGKHRVNRAHGEHVPSERFPSTDSSIQLFYR